MRVIDCPGERRVRENRMHGVGGGGRNRADDAQPHVDRWVAYRWRASRLPHRAAGVLIDADSYIAAMGIVLPRIDALRPEFDSCRRARNSEVCVLQQLCRTVRARACY